MELDNHFKDEDVDEDLDEKEPIKSIVHINHLPQVVFEYILSHLSPYKDLSYCKLVSKSWDVYVKSTIEKLKRDFINSLTSMNVEWQNYHPSGGPSISPRYSHSACCLGDSVYIFGGCTVANTTFNDLWRFDLASRCWIRPIATGTFPSPKASASFVNYKDNIILFGGWSHSTPNFMYYLDWRISNNVHMFNTETNRWSLIEVKSFSPSLTGHSASVIDDKMIVFGGLQRQACHNIDQVDIFECSNDIWILDLNTWVWTKKEVVLEKPNPRYFHSQMVLDSNHILIMGGCGGANMLFNDIWLLTIPKCQKQAWEWKEIQMNYKDSSVQPHTCFQPACKVGDLVVVLDSVQKYRTLECKDSKILKEPSERVQFVNQENSNEGNKTAKLEPQSSPSPSTSSHRTSPDQSNSLRMKNRQRQLEGLDRMEQRIKQLKSNKTFTPFPIKSATIRYVNAQPPNNPMQMFVLDISEVIEKHHATWLAHKKIIESPDEIMLYTLVAGRAELIMFGGIHKQKNGKLNDNQLANPDVVSNQLHIISAKRIII